MINLDDQLRAQRMKKNKITVDRGIREEQERAYLKSLEEDKKKVCYSFSWPIFAYMDLKLV